MNNLKPYAPEDLRVMFYEPWRLGKNPYMQYAAYALSCLCEAAIPIDYEEEPGESDPRNSMWGEKVPKRIVDNITNQAKEGFLDAASNRRQIDIWGRHYSIRKAEAFDPDRLSLIFDFPVSEGEYLIVPEGVMNIGDDSLNQRPDSARDEIRENITYLRQVVMLAEDDAHDGWDRLTDMEVAMYCWALYFNNCGANNLTEFTDRYKGHLAVSTKEMQGCFTDKALFCEKPCGMHTFSAKKVKDWNLRNGQRSEAELIDPSCADDYWFEKAILTTFIPF